MAQTIAEKTRELRELAPGVWTITYPLSVLGDEHGRVVTILALASGKLIIHSTGPFAPEEVAAIHELGHPSWLVEASLLHDTFSKQGRAAFPDLPYLGPSGLEKKLHQPVEPLSNSPMEWRGDVDMFELAGMPRVREFIFLHRPSGTLILGDLLHHFNEEETNWEHVVRHYAMGIRNHLGVPRLFRTMVKDRMSFESSLRMLMACEFDRVIVAHKRPIEHNAKARVKEALEHAFPHLHF